MKKLTYSAITLFIVIAGSCFCQNHLVFGPEKKVTIVGYTLDAMEPFISPGGNTLFFNSLNSGGNTNLHYASKVNDTTFNYVGLVGGTHDTSSNHLDGVPSIDSANNFFWVSLRGYPAKMENLHRGKYNVGSVTNITRVYGNFNVYAFNYPFGWLIMDAAINYQTDQLYYCNALFDVTNTTCVGVPCKARLGVAQKMNDSTFNKLSNSEGIFSHINDTNYVVYAPVISTDGKELYFSRFLKNTFNTEICVAVRSNPSDTFSLPSTIHSNLGYVPEAPTLTTDKSKIYYHQKDASLIFKLYLRERAITTGLSNLTDNNAFRIFPNPTKNKVFVNLIKPDEKFRIELVDMIGRKIAVSTSSTTIDMTQLLAGVYCLKVYQGEWVGVKKIVKE